MRITTIDTIKKIGENILVFGWVSARRDHGKIIFIDLRDRSGIVQLVFTPKDEKIYKLADQLRSEWVIEIEGDVQKRPEGMENKNIPTGEIEIAVKKLQVLNEAKTPPFEISDDGYNVNEETRLKYRYLDLRRDRLQKNLTLRHQINQFIRNWLTDQEFLEIETPILTKSTPEGARDFVVPSRLHPGKFYALPQSPQQYKQLLMVAGFEKYFQMARCFRDEDTRGDRQPEFTQLDLEMSFVKREDVMAIIEKLLINLIKNLTPYKKIQEIPFPRLTHQEAMKKYKTDRPDLRKNSKDQDLLAFCWITDFPFFEKSDEGKLTFTHNPFSAPIEKHMEWLLKKERVGEILTSQYDIVLNGLEIGGGSIRNHQASALEAVFEILGHSKEEIRQKFGHMLEAFELGAPPHGGIALGLDRIIAILTNEPNIREVMAFPKTGDGYDPMMDSPDYISEKHLKELHIETKKKK